MAAWISSSSTKYSFKQYSFRIFIWLPEYLLLRLNICSKYSFRIFIRLPEYLPQQNILSKNICSFEYSSCCQLCEYPKYSEFLEYSGKAHAGSHRQLPEYKIFFHMISVWNIHTVAHCMNIFDRIFVRNIHATTSFMNILDLTCYSEHFWDETGHFGYFGDGVELLNLSPNDSSSILFGKNSLVGSSILKITSKA